MKTCLHIYLPLRVAYIKNRRKFVSFFYFMYVFLELLIACQTFVLLRWLEAGWLSDVLMWFSCVVVVVMCLFA